MRLTRPFLLLPILLLIVVAPSLRALTPETSLAAYESMKSWIYGSAQPIPAGGITIKRDVATFTMTSGTIRLMRPAGGASHGLVFEGNGTMKIEVPHPTELYQLRRFTGDPSLDSLESTFTELFIRTSDDAATLTGLTFGGGADENATAKKRHEHWFVEEWLDADARIIAAALNDGDLFERVDALTEKWDWICFTYDSFAREEISVSHFSDGYTESWLGLEKSADRGRNDSTFGVIDLDQFHIRGDLTKSGKGQAVGATMEKPTDALFTIDLTFISKANGVNALQFSLDPEARDVVVKTEEGRVLTTLRDHLGSRSIRIDKKYHDPVLTIVLDRPLMNDEVRTLRFEYSLEIPTFAFGDSWYPTRIDDWTDTYTAHMEFTTRKRHELKSMGRFSGKGDSGDNETSTWEVSKPASMLTFSIASRFDEKTIEIDDVPPVHSFGPTIGLSGRNKVKDVGIDIANSLRFFSWLYNTPLKEEQFYATAIPAGHGQAFDGFLHLAESTYQADTAGATELFRAHEVAHQWWGHRVQWASYRDQWISEAFAEYGAMMFVQTTVKGGEKYFDEILEVYDANLKGSISGGFSRFNRPWLTAINPKHRGRVGPISHGRRAGTKEIPAGYVIQAYVRGPMVLHMLRRQLMINTRSDDMFIGILRDFVKEYSGKPATTEDFRHIVERRTKNDFGWFFDQWIDRSEIPHLDWSYTTSKVPEGGTLLKINFSRRDGDGFILPVPVHVEFEDGRSGTILLNVDEEQKSFEQKLPGVPKKVTVNPNYALLITTKQKR